MSPEERLVAALTADVGLMEALGYAVRERLFAVRAPAMIGPPLIVWQVAPSSFSADLDGQAMVRRAVQVDVYAETYRQTAAISGAIRALVHGHEWADDGTRGAILSAAIETETDSFDPESGVARRILDLRLLARD